MRNLFQQISITIKFPTFGDENFTNWPFSLKYTSNFLLLKGEFCSEKKHLFLITAYLSVVFHESLNWRGLNQTLLLKFNVAQPHCILDCLAWGGKAWGTTAHAKAQQFNSCYWKRKRELHFCPYCCQKDLSFPELPLWCKIPSTGKETPTSKGSGQTTVTEH